MFTLLCGSSCTIQRKAPLPVDECVPDIQIVDRMVTLAPELTQTQHNPPVPNSGDVIVLVDWTLACAANTRKLNDQMEAIRNAERRE